MTDPCQRPECGGETHTDGWGNPIQCPARRCPRCDCPDNAPQCEHCKVCPHADRTPTAATPAEPVTLTVEQLYTLVVAVQHRENSVLLGRPVPTLPSCPTCQQAPERLSSSSDIANSGFRLSFQPCRHTFIANADDLSEAYTLARQQPEPPLPDDGTYPEAPPVPTPLEEAQATIESLRYQIRRAREALATDEPDSAEAAISRVRALHREEIGLCEHCTREDGVPYPCPTIRALDGAPTKEHHS